MQKETLLFIGYGNMMQSILEGAHEKLSQQFNLQITGRNPQKIAPFLKEKNIDATIISIPPTKIIDIKNKFVFLLYKPYNLHDFNYEGEAKSIISALAGVSFKSLCNTFYAKYYLKCMPNIASKFALSSSAICEYIPSQTKEIETISQNTLEIIQSFGLAINVSNEEQVNASVATNGSSLAFLSLVASALKDAGIREGLNAKDSLALVSMTFKGFAKLLENERPEMITEQICTPKGTTIEGLSVLEKMGVRGAFIEACHASVEKMRPKS
ncbi:pyrroline-5-carboxylate reductase [Helicobacter cetorum]|uniref:Pyrroline-5-carboxylate reductase n=1 Tax=Helicobacter cetorum (strain ATCC BAA-429 / MIT 00-7128) TaxID=182217 RepID=I0ELS6_HELC0|nr:pyrroline-5-carboxylate reductase [Helicobacter cetorum]AFI03895.1 pyrroline-5-carboxylate reductase [Helicobacter cetorum MIT 00-7128]